MKFKTVRSLRPSLMPLAVFSTLAMSMPAVCGVIGASNRLPLTTLADVPLPGRATRWDYASLDAQHHHLFLAHLGDGAVVVFDTVQRKVIATIADRIVGRTDLPGADGNHDLYIDAASQLAFIACEGNNRLLVFDLASRKLLSTFFELVS